MEQEQPDFLYKMEQQANVADLCMVVSNVHISSFYFDENVHLSLRQW